jgi:hypothetical protein
LPWLAAERPHVFNAYQQTQGEKVENVMQSMKGRGYVASFIGNEPGKAAFVGLYSIGAFKRLSHKQYWQVPAYREMKSFGMKGFTADDPKRQSILWFDLKLRDFYSHWKGRLVVGWPPPERSWWRRAHKNRMPVLAVLDESLLDAAMPEWSDMNLGWQALAALPTRWKMALSQWRGIYFIFDTSDRKGYVGSAYGKSNILGRWLNYGARGHGGNRLLRGRNPKNFRFSILQRLSPDTEPAEVIRIESTWKQRLHTRQPFGLNDN